MEIKVKTFNEDGSVAFDGVLKPQEAQLVLEVGVNFLLAQGTLPFLSDDEDDEPEAEDFVVPVESSNRNLQ